jgi:hypothetical protein
LILFRRERSGWFTLEEVECWEAVATGVSSSIDKRVVPAVDLFALTVCSSAGGAISWTYEFDPRLLHKGPEQLGVRLEAESKPQIVTEHAERKTVADITVLDPFEYWQGAPPGHCGPKCLAAVGLEWGRWNERGSDRVGNLLPVATSVNGEAGYVPVHVQSQYRKKVFHFITSSRRKGFFALGCSEEGKPGDRWIHVLRAGQKGSSVRSPGPSPQHRDALGSRPRGALPSSR